MPYLLFAIYALSTVCNLCGGEVILQVDVIIYVISSFSNFVDIYICFNNSSSLLVNI